MLRLLDRVLSSIPAWRRLRRHPGFRTACGFEETLWTRKVADEQVRHLAAALDPGQLSALEVSGTVWRDFGFKSYRHTTFPEFDICADVLAEKFDLVIAEHIFEHLVHPSRAARNVLRMLKPGGHFLIVTPFLYRVHHNPVDCTRWTETGLRHFLAECGFPSEQTTTGSWGNHECVKATLRQEFILFNRHLHSLENEPQYPIAVWALAGTPD